MSNNSDDLRSPSHDDANEPLAHSAWTTSNGRNATSTPKRRGLGAALLGALFFGLCFVWIGWWLFDFVQRLPSNPIVRILRGQQPVSENWWMALGIVLWFVIYEAANRFHLWNWIVEREWAGFVWLQRLVFSGLCALVGSWLLYRFLREDKKESWLLVAALVVVAYVTLSSRFRDRFGWIGLGAVMYLPVVAFGHDLIRGDEWNFWRSLVFAIALFIAGLLGPLTSGDPSLGVALGCWAIAYGVWWLRKRVFGNALHAKA